MMPKTSVRPLATTNSRSPYCTPFSTWIRKKTTLSMRNQGDDIASNGMPGLEPGIRMDRRGEPGRDERVRGKRALGHRAADVGVRERLDGDAHVLVLEPFDLAQVHVLQRV